MRRNSLGAKAGLTEIVFEYHPTDGFRVALSIKTETSAPSGAASVASLWWSEWKGSYAPVIGWRIP
jgi:hypothetical protein